MAMANICKEREYWGTHLYLLMRLFLANKSPGQFEKAMLCRARLFSSNLKSYESYTADPIACIVEAAFPISPHRKLRRQIHNFIA